MKMDYMGTMMDALQMKLVTCEKAQVVMTMPVFENTMQPMRLLHGGASVALAESVASVGTMLFVNPETQTAVGLEINANHVRSATGGIVTATGVPLHAGRKTVVWDIRIHDEDNHLICVSRCTVAIVSKKS